MKEEEEIKKQIKIHEDAKARELSFVASSNSSCDNTAIRCDWIREHNIIIAALKWVLGENEEHE